MQTNPTTYVSFPGEINQENLDDLLAFHRTRFGGWVMEETDGSDDTENEDSTDSEDSQEENEQEQSEESEENSSEDNEDESHESSLDLDGAKSALKKVRGEAAALRVKNKELVEALAAAKSPEEIQTLIADAVKAQADANHSLVVENVARQHKLTDELMQVLADASNGKSREEMEAHAKVLAKYLPADEQERDIDPDKLGGGLDPSDEDGPFDPKVIAAKNRAARYR